MREIKFRAWFPARYFSEPHMAYSPTNKDDDFGGRSATWDLIELLDSGKPDHPIYMQYTGLKDKNGKDIYEGDILHTSKGNGKITWEEARFWFDGEAWPYAILAKNAHCSTEALEIGCDVSEIIGNIYENPELLESE